MLLSKQIEKRQSEIREKLAELAGYDVPKQEQRDEMAALDSEYQTNETRYRAALTSEDEERRAAGEDLDTGEGKEWAGLVAGYEMRQAALALAEGRALDGATAEVVQEMREQGGFQGVPVPVEALEERAGETVASGVPERHNLQPIIDRLFPASVMAKMGARLVNIGAGINDYPVTTSSVTASWATTETGSVAGPTKYETSGRELEPNHNLGVQVQVTRRALKQVGGGLEDAIRRDLRGTIQAELDKAVFEGSGSNGQPAGVVAKANNYSIGDTAIGAELGFDDVTAAVAAFMAANAATSGDDVRLMFRPEVWGNVAATIYDQGSGVTVYEKIAALLSNVYASNVLASPTGGPPEESKALLSTTAGGVSPIFVGVWGGIDLIRDPYTDAKSGGLRLTGLLTADVDVSRPAQLQTLSQIQTPAA